MAVDASALVSLEAAEAALHGTLRRLRLRLRLVLAARLATIGVTIGAAALTALIGVERLYAVTHPAGDAIMPLLVACAAALLAAAIWPLPDRRIARSADRRLDLWDRMATASALARAAEPSGMERAQIADTVRHIALIRPAAAYPLRLDRLTQIMLGCLVALAVVQFAPIPPLLLSVHERKENAELREIARQITPVAERLRVQAEEAEDEESREAARRLRTLARRMERGEIDKREALLELSEIEEKLAAAEQEIQPPSLRTARAAAEQIGQSGREAMAKRAEELAETARRRGETELEETLRKLAEKARESQNAQELHEAAEEIAECAGALGQEMPLSTLLDAAAAAIEAEDWEQVACDLEALGQALCGGDRELSAAEARELAESLQGLAQKLQGTDLAQLAESLQATADAVMQGDLAGAAGQLAAATQAGTEGLGASQLAAAVRDAHAGADAAAAALRSPGARAATRSTEEGRGVGPDRGTRQGIPPDAEGASLYAPREADVEATPQGMRAGMRPGGEMHTAPTRGAPDQVSPSRVPYYEVVGEYSRAAEEALEREEVPPAYRGTVRQYFESLQTGEPAAPSEERSDD